MLTKEQSVQIVSVVGRNAIKYSGLLAACPFLTELALTGIIQDDFVGCSENALRWNNRIKDVPLLRFVKVPSDFEPHYNFADNDCFELAPAGLNLLYESQKEKHHEEIAQEAVNISRQANALSEKSNKLSEESVALAKESNEYARQSNILAEKANKLSQESNKIAANALLEAQSARYIAKWAIATAVAIGFASPYIAECLKK